MSGQVERIPQHRHCANCKKAFVGDGLYCSPACEKGRTEELKSKKNKLVIVWVGAVVFMLIGIWLMLGL